MYIAGQQRTFHWCERWVASLPPSQRDRRRTALPSWPFSVFILDMPEAALRLAFDAVIAKAGQVWADGLTLEIIDPKQVKTTEPTLKFVERSASKSSNRQGTPHTEAAEIYGRHRQVCPRAGGRAFAKMPGAAQPRLRALNTSPFQVLSLGSLQK